MHYSSYERRAADELAKRRIGTLRVFSGLASPGGYFSEAELGGHTSKDKAWSFNLPSSLCIICRGAVWEMPTGSANDTPAGLKFAPTRRQPF